MQIGVLGATGPAGRGLAARLAAIGHEVVAGSRDRGRAERIVDELRDQWGERCAWLRAGTNAEAAAAPDLVVIATHWESAVESAVAHADALDHKVIVSMANGLHRVGREFRAVLPEGGSLAATMQSRVPTARVTAAFHLIPAEAFGNLESPIDSDVVVCGSDDDARALVMDLAASIPDLRAFDGGSIANAIGLEAFAAVLLTVNLRHRGKARLRLLGVESPA